MIVGSNFSKRQLSFPVSTISQWWVSRSSSAVVILASPKTLGHSPKKRAAAALQIFSGGARVDQYREKVQSLQANSRLYAVRS